MTPSRAGIQLLLAFLLSIGALFLWHFLYQVYITQTGYYGDVFRPAMANNLAPVYGQWNPDVLLGCIQGIIILLCLLPWVINSNANPRWAIVSLSISAFIPWVLIPGEVLVFTSHWETFANDLYFFSSPSDVWNHFNDYQSKGVFDVHNNHYPPLNLWLLKIFEPFSPGVIKGLFSALNILTWVLMLRHLQSQGNGNRIWWLLLAPAIILYPSLEPQGLFLLLFFLSWRCLSNKVFSSSNALIFGGLCFLLCLSSFFSVLLIAGWAGLSIVQILRKETSLNDQIKFWGISSAVLLTGFFLLQLTAGFSWFDCLFTSIKNNTQLGASGFDNIIRYLFRSSGNGLAFIAGMGFIIPLAYFFTDTPWRVPTGGGIVNLFWLLFTIAASFSGLFFLETERIWIPIFMGMILTWPASTDFNYLLSHRWLRFGLALFAALIAGIWKPFL